MIGENVDRQIIAQHHKERGTSNDLIMLAYFVVETDTTLTKNLKTSTHSQS